MISNFERRAWLRAAACLVALPLAAHANPPIDAAVAPLYVGHELLVEGVVTAAERDGYIVRLRLGQPPQTLTVQLVLGMLSRFPSQPEEHYLGRRVRVYGTISEFRGKAEIIVRDPDRIAVHDDTSTADAENAGALRERVERLEERLRAIERGSGAPTERE